MLDSPIACSPRNRVLLESVRIAVGVPLKPGVLLDGETQ